MYFAYAWIVVVGGLMIFLGWPPREPICIVCGPTLLLVAGIISLAIGITGLIRQPRGPNTVAIR